MMRTQTKINYLEKARDLIADKKNWCQGVQARNKNGRPCEHPKDRDAKRFCAIGAVQRVIRNDGNYVFNTKTLCKLLSCSCEEQSIVEVNDTSTGHAHRRVIGAFNRTIKKLQKQL